MPNRRRNIAERSPSEGTGGWWRRRRRSSEDLSTKVAEPEPTYPAPQPLLDEDELVIDKLNDLADLAQIFGTAKELVKDVREAEAAEEAKKNPADGRKRIKMAHRS